MENGRRKLKLVLKNLPLPADVQVEEVLVALRPEVNQFVHNFLGIWEKSLSTKIDKKDMYIPAITARLQSFTQEEMLSAQKNRINFVLKSDWHQLPENKAAATSIEFLIRDDESVLKWLNTKIEDAPEQKLVAFNKN